MDRVNRLDSYRNIAAIILLSFIILMLPNVAYASNNSDSDAGGIFAILLLSGPAFYFWKIKKYKGTNLRHEYEVDTESKIWNIKGDEVFLYSESHNKHSSIGGIDYSNGMGSGMGVLADYMFTPMSTYEINEARLKRYQDRIDSISVRDINGYNKGIPIEELTKEFEKTAKESERYAKAVEAGLKRNKNL